jgi:two-component system, NtrC family, nitrogen regulation response regulator GlnG
MTEETPPSNTSDTSEVGLARLVEHQLARYINADRQVLPASGLYDRIIHEVERPLLRLVLNLVNGNKIQAAKVLGINRNTLLKKLRQHGLDGGKKLSAADKATHRSREAA